MIIAAIPITLIEVLWDNIAIHLEKAVALSNNETSLESIKNKALNGDLLLMTVNDGGEIIAAFTLEVILFDTGKRSLFLGSVGAKNETNLDNWMFQALKVCKAIAKDMNCTELRGGSARKGWMRKLKDSGWKETHTTIVCEVT